MLTMNKTVYVVKGCNRMFNTFLINSRKHLCLPGVKSNLWHHCKSRNKLASGSRHSYSNFFVTSSIINGVSTKTTLRVLALHSNDIKPVN
jgi:hypothetical protein